MSTPPTNPNHPASILQATIALSLMVLFIQSIFIPLITKPSEYIVDCNQLKNESWIAADKQSNNSDGTIHRFSPHNSETTGPDTDIFTATPQVFRTIAAYKSQSDSTLRHQQCQAVYTDVAARHGADMVEMPAHCFFAKSSDRDKTKLDSNNTQGLRTRLNNYCVYMGDDVTQAEAIFKIEEIFCKSNPYSQSVTSKRQHLLNDSCLVKLDKKVPKTIRDKPLTWWQPDLQLQASTTDQILDLLGIYTDEFSCNIKSGNIESNKTLQLISHSIDYDGQGKHRVVSKGKAIYQHSVEGVILSPGIIPNDIDTRSGDSGGAVIVYDEGVKKLLAIQIAVMTSYSDAKLNDFRRYQNSNSSNDSSNHSSNYLRNYNVAVNPHITSESITGFPYSVRADPQ